ncbi:MAG: hypothetical protein AB1490_09310 [Pseudomonadota bacterium]
MTSATADDNADDGPRDPTYIYKPALIGAHWQLSLTPEGLAYSVGRHSGVVRYDRIRRVRLAFRPVTMQTQRYLTEIWSPDAPKLQIASCSWRSIVEQERQDAAYSAFVTELHKRLAAVNSQALFQNGLPAILFGIGAVVYVVALLGFVALAFRAFQTGDKAASAFVLLFFVLFAWQVGTYFYRNKPGRYRPDALPEHLLPKG